MIRLEIPLKMKMIGTSKDDETFPDLPKEQLAVKIAVNTAEMILAIEQLINTFDPSSLRVHLVPDWNPAEKTLKNYILEQLNK